MTGVVIGEAKSRGAHVVEASQSAEDEWCAEIAKGSDFQQLQASCTPSYFNDEGKAAESEGWLAGFYPEGFEAFFALLREWRAKGDLEGLEVR